MPTLLVGNMHAIAPIPADFTLLPLLGSIQGLEQSYRFEGIATINA